MGEVLTFEKTEQTIYGLLGCGIYMRRLDSTFIAAIEFNSDVLGERLSAKFKRNQKRLRLNFATT